MSGEADDQPKSKTKELILLLLEMYWSLVSSIGLIVLFVAPRYALQIIGGVLLVATILFVGGYLLASQNKPEGSDEGGSST